MYRVLGAFIPGNKSVPPAVRTAMALVRAIADVCVPAGRGADLKTDEPSRAKKFERLFTPHLEAAYGYAHWLTRDSRNAEEVVQEACLRAFRFLDSFNGDSANLARRILGALLGFEGGQGFNAAALDAMTPDAILLLDVMLAAIGDMDATSLWRPRGELLH